MSAHKRNLAPVIISAWDLSFALLFFFIGMGGGNQKVERIDLPFKGTETVSAEESTPFRIEIYADQPTGDTCRMALISNAAVPDTLNLTIAREALNSPGAFTSIRENIAGFISGKQIAADAIFVDVFSSVYSYYGLVAITVAACNELNYPCNLVYQTEGT